MPPGCSECGSVQALREEVASPRGRTIAQRVRTGVRRWRTKIRGNIEHNRLPLPHRPAFARDKRTTGLEASSIIHNVEAGTPEQAAISAIFSGVRENPLLQIQVSSHVTKRANPSPGKSWSILAAALLWLTIGSAVHSQPAPSSSSAPTSSSPTPTGEWLVADRVARIKIVDCGGRLWGVVAWEARPGGTDQRNPDPQLRSRPTLGMPILLDMTPTKPNRWEGQVYNSQNGKTYSASISLSDPNTLRIQGCVFGFLCGGENWTRVEASDTVGRAPAQTPTRPAPGRKTATPQPSASDDVCSRVLGAAGLSHERGLK
jgi:uncharacterized protein (DUF2147 family)